MKNRMKDLLESCNSKLEHLKTPFLRADALLSLLRIESINNQQKLFTSTRNVTEMLDLMDNFDFVADLDFSIALLESYLKTNEFYIVIPKNTFSKDLADRQMAVREIIIQMIEVEPNTELL